MSESVLAQAWEQTVQDMRESYVLEAGQEKPCEWRQPSGVREYRPWCKADGRFYGWTLEINKNYPRTPSKVMKAGHPHMVFFNGAVVQTWKCAGCGHKVVK